MTTVGLLSPGHTAEEDFPRIEMLLDTDVRLPVVRTDIAEPEALAQGVEELRLAGAECVVWASSSGSFMYGWDGAHDHARALATAAGLPASSTSFAFTHAVRALGVERVAVAATYPRDVTDRFVDFLRASGVEVAAPLSPGAPVSETPDEVAAWEFEQVLELARSGDHPDAEALLLPDTVLHTAAHLPDLEKALGKPVLAAHQVTVWEGLRLAERRARAPRLGELFAARE